MKLQGLGELRDSRKDYEAVIMQFMLNRKGLYGEMLSCKFSFRFFILDLPKYRFSQVC